MADQDPLIPSIKYATFDTLGDGSTTSWEFNFAGGYISRDHVKAFTQDLVTGELRIISPLTFTGPNTVSITPAVPDGIRLVIYRDTPKESPIVDYTEGSIINERNLDVSNLQSVFIAAELADRVVADYDFSNALLYAVVTATAAAATANGIDAKATAALNTSATALADSAEALTKANANTLLLAKDFRVSKYATLQLAIDAIEAAGGGTLWIDKPVVTSGPITMDPNKVCIQGTHATVAEINFSSTPATPLAEDFMVKWRNHTKTVGRKRPFAAVTLVGPPASRKWNCFPMMSSNLDGMTNYEFQGVNIIDFKVQMYYGPQCSNVSWIGSQFSQTGENFHTTAAIMASLDYGVTNGGEGWSYTDCQFNNVSDCVWSNIGIAGGWSFVQCTLVYFKRCITLLAPAKVTIGDGCHIEGGTYSNFWFTTRQNGCIIRMHDTELWCAGTVSNYLFSSGSDTIFGGIFLDRVDYHIDAITVSQMADPTQAGEIHAPYWRGQDSLPRPVFGRNAGVNPEPWMTNNAAWGQGWIALSGDVSTVAVDAGNQHDGISATTFMVSAVGEQISRRRRWPCKGGQVINGHVWLRTAGFAAAGSNVGLYVVMLDSDGNSIGAGGNPYTLPLGTDQTEWLKVSLNWTPGVPAGAAFYELRAYANPGVNAGNRYLILSDHVINIH